jgi:hypothetical protein
MMLENHAKYRYLTLPPSPTTESGGNEESGTELNTRGKNGTAKGNAHEAVKLKVGEALLFAPSMVVNLDVEDGGDLGLQKLGTGS